MLENTTLKVSLTKWHLWLKFVKCLWLSYLLYLQRNHGCLVATDDCYKEPFSPVVCPNCHLKLNQKFNVSCDTKQTLAISEPEPQSAQIFFHCDLLTFSFIPWTDLPLKNYPHWLDCDDTTPRACQALVILLIECGHVKVPRPSRE